LPASTSVPAAIPPTSARQAAWRTVAATFAYLISSPCGRFVRRLDSSGTLSHGYGLGGSCSASCQRLRLHHRRRRLARLRPDEPPLRPPDHLGSSAPCPHPYTAPPRSVPSPPSLS